MAKIIDGIINKELYEKAKYKILWILKEPNDKDSNEKWTYQDYFSKKEIERKIGTEEDTLRYRMMKKIIWNSYGLLHDNTLFDEIENQIEDERIYSITEEIAYINIKKTPGGGAAIYKEIKAYYEQNKDLLIEQIKAFKPNIIIFGGTLTFFEYEDLEKANLDIRKDNKFHSMNGTSRMSFYDISEDVLLIHAYHPAYWSISYKQYYEEMIDGLKEWKKNKHMN